LSISRFSQKDEIDVTNGQRNLTPRARHIPFGVMSSALGLRGLFQANRLLSALSYSLAIFSMC